MNTVMKATDSAEFLGLVPALAGFTPRRSIVLVPFRASRAHGAMRIDLPGEDIDEEEYVDTAIGLLSRVKGVDAVAIVVYADELPLHTRDGMVLPRTVVVEGLLSVAADSGLRIVDALCVMPSGWSCYLDVEPDLAPLDDIPGPVTFPGEVAPSHDQGAGTELPAVDLAEKERVGRAMRELAHVLAHDHAPRGRENPQALAAMVMLDDMPQFFESLLEYDEDPPPFVTAALLWCLDRPVLRDAALLHWATDLPTGIRALDEQLGYVTERDELSDDLTRLFVGRGAAPDAERLRIALRVLREAAARAPRASRPAPLTLAAWISWSLGRATHAQRYLDMVAEIDPAYSLAGLLHALIDTAVLPEWTFRRGGGLEGG